MKEFTVIVTEIYQYHLGVKADNKEDAINKVKNIYHSGDLDNRVYDFTATANTHEKTTFTAKKGIEEWMGIVLD